jgi:copper(I)-binding protein
MKASLFLVPILAAVVSAAQAQVTVSDAWVRGTVAQQRVTGLFFRITSTNGGKLVAVSTPVARDVQLHEMAMSNDVMRMRQVQAIDLPPGKTVELQPNGYHVMLFDVVKPLSAGDIVPATLTVEDANGKRQVQVKARVEALGAPHAVSTMSGMGATSGGKQ